MSDDLYFARLRYTRGNGVAKLHGHALVLNECPQFLAVEIEEVDYAPEVKAWRVRDRNCGWRDMQSHEAQAADALLHRLFIGVPRAAAA